MMPRGRPFVTQDPDKRFWGKVNKTDTCWLWTGAVTTAGYGSFSVGHKNFGAHRWAYERLVGPIPDGLTIDHLCRITICVNPAHLEPVTIRENIKRGTPYNALKTHCPQGHAYDEANTVIYQGHRQCRACGKNRDKARKKARETP